jgi:hypothetical protein
MGCGAWSCVVGAISAASASDRPSSANFAEQYVPKPGMLSDACNDGPQNPRSAMIAL